CVCALCLLSPLCLFLYFPFLLISCLLFSPLPFFFFNHPATTEIYTLSLHDALPILYCTFYFFSINNCNNLIFSDTFLFMYFKLCRLLCIFLLIPTTGS